MATRVFKASKPVLATLAALRRDGIRWDTEVPVFGGLELYRTVERTDGRKVIVFQAEVSRQGEVVEEGPVFACYG